MNDDREKQKFDEKRQNTPEWPSVRVAIPVYSDA